jgi:predicted ATPase/DNA-binding CsgD family transcriptional regulator
MTGLPQQSFLCPVTIGRRAELEALRIFLDRDGGLLLISGEAGVGKSCLVREARGLAAERGLRVLEGRCFEADRALPFAPALDILRALVDSHGTAETLRLAGAAAPELSRLLPELSADSTTVDPDRVDRAAAKRRLLDGFARLLTRIASEQPLLLVIEDIHWLDASSLDLLLHLARRSELQGERLLLLMTYRGDEGNTELEHCLATLDRERLGTEIRLDRLDASQVAAMLQAIFGVESPVPAELLHAIFSLTEGNPFFIEELLTVLGPEQGFVAAHGGWTRDQLRHPRIPRSIHGAILQRLQSLSDPARDVLTLAAVAGRRFDFDLLRALSKLDEETLLDLMKELVAGRLVVEESGDRFVFRHALTREAIYAGLLDRERRLLHRRVAEAIELHYATSLESRLDDLATHYDAAGSWTEALEASYRAGMRAASLHAPRAAADQFTRAIKAARALGLAPDPQIHQERGRAYETVGEFEHALADYELALDLTRAAGNLHAEWRILLDLGLLWASRDYAQAGRFASLALEVARKIGDPNLIAHALNRLGNWQLNNEQPKEAIALHREALAILETQGNERGVAETLDLLGMATAMGADATAAMRWNARAAEHWRGMGDPRGLAASLAGCVLSAYTYHSSTVASALRIEDVRVFGEESLALSREIGWRAGESHALWGYCGMTLGAAGLYSVALPATKDALKIASEIEHRQWMTAARCILGNLYGDLGSREVARVELEAALEMAREIGSPFWVRSAAAWLASALIEGDTFADAAALLREELGDETPFDTIAGRLLWCAAVELALAQGDSTRALELIDRLVAAAPGNRTRPIARLEFLRGRAWHALGRHREAATALVTAREGAVWSGARPLLWRIEISHGQVLQAQRMPDEAHRAFASATALLEELAREAAGHVTRETFLAFASRELPMAQSPSVPGPASASASPLTKRELQVAVLLTEGLTNREVGRQLFLSEWTVATHVRNILAKLELSSRAQIAAWAAGRGITREG